LTIINGGAGYVNPPIFLFSAQPGGPAMGQAVLSNGAVVAAIITNPGAGYLTTPTVSFGSFPNPTTQATATVNPVFQSATLAVNGAVVSSNTAGMLGGGIGNAGTGGVAITNSTVDHNTTGGFGGGFADQNNQGNLTVTNSLFVGNSAATDGGAIQEGGPTTTITGSELLGNSAAGAGGGIFANGVTLTVTASTIANNVAGTNGGGIELATTGPNAALGLPPSIITNSTITGNRVLNNGGAGNGGGIDASFTAVAGTNPAVNPLLANSTGGSTAFTGAATLVFDTVSSNFADNGGGIFLAAHAGIFNTIALEETLVARNQADVAGPDLNNAAGAFTAGGGNFIGTTSGSSGITPVATGDPLLGPLQDNGGLTTLPDGSHLLTEALRSGSPAVGTGGNFFGTASDERGFARPTGVGTMVSIGAFEPRPASPITVPFTPPVVTPAVPAPTLIPNADVPAGTVLSGNQVVVLLTTGMHKGKKVHRLLVLNGTGSFILGRLVLSGLSLKQYGQLLGLGKQQVQALPTFNGSPAIDLFLLPYGQQTVDVPAGNGFLPQVIAGL
jgi:hypothetical protein